MQAAKPSNLFKVGKKQGWEPAGWKQKTVLAFSPALVDLNTGFFFFFLIRQQN